MAQILQHAYALVARAVESSEPSDPDPGKAPAAGQKEIDSSLALLILIILLIAAFLASYVLQSKRIQAVHETVVSIFAGMVVGLILRLASGAEESGADIRQIVSFNYQFFFNLLLPPIILASGFELHQGNFFRNIGTILTFAFAGTFISALVLGAILWAWTLIPIEGITINFVDAIGVGATLSATDPITILAIFNAYKVDPKLYTIIFGESILNDAIAIVLFETAQKYSAGAIKNELTILSFFESIGVFLIVFFASLAIGIVIGIATSLLLKLTHIRRDPKIESCLIFLIAYSSYFLANAVHLSGIVSLLFCGICLKHYAYHNMSRRTQLTVKFVFSLTAQLSENFIFIYLGLSIFTDVNLEYKPALILVTVFGICIARWCAVFPLAALINWFIRYRARRRGQEVAEELPHNWKIMIFWAGLRGAVGVALAEGLSGKTRYALRATVLLVVILSVIIFGGTTARMLEILQIRTGVVEEIDSDDEFDIEPVPHYTRKNGALNGSKHKNGNIGLGVLNGRVRRGSNGTSSYSTGSANSSPPVQPDFSRRSSRNRVDTLNNAEQGLLGHDNENILVSDDENDLNLPPQARRAPTWPADLSEDAEHRDSNAGTSAPMTARGAINAVLNATSEDAGSLFTKLDENFLKPHLLLDPGSSGKHGSGSS